MYRGSLSDDGFDDLDAGDIGGGRHASGGWRSRPPSHANYDEPDDRDDYGDDAQGDLTTYLRPVASRRSPTSRSAGPPRSSRLPGPTRFASSSRLPRPSKFAPPSELSEYAGYAVMAFIAVAIVMIFIVLLLNR
ncbi:MAG TPA: hypothetical protein VG317_04305 [Pseudonocardiaceae bacterium]|jgi:hypothetical protein|nr:hypothetical protein [Pseudonocardiaceae bacterium]